MSPYKSPQRKYAETYLLFLVALITILVVATLGCAQGETGRPGKDGLTVVGPRGPSGRDGNSCTVEQTSFGAVIYCTDGTVAGVQNGSSIVGPKGDTGAAGSSCSVTSIHTGALVACSDGTLAELLDGANGADGQSIVGAVGPSGADGVSPVIDFIAPCAGRAAYPEVIMRVVTATGTKLYGILEGTHDYGILLVPGSWRTSDSAQCPFTITNDYQVIL